MRERTKVTNINNYVRDDWYKTVDCIAAFCDDEYDKGMYICKMIDEMQEKRPKYYRLFVSVMFADYYKLLYYYCAQRNIYPEKLEFFDELNDLDDLLDKIEDDRSILDDFTLRTFSYGNYDHYDKKQIINSNYSRNKYLLRMCPTHILDLIETAKNYNAEDLLYFYQDYLERFGTDGYKEAVESILVTINALYRYDRENYEEILSDMISVYYKYKKYLDNNITLTPGEHIIIKMLETETMETIFDNASNYSIILEEIVENYLLFSNNQTGISNEEVEKYINDNINKKVKEKLKLFKPKIKSL